MLAAVSRMVALTYKRGAQIGAVVAFACIGLAAAGCRSSCPSTSSSKPSGTVNVAYASSLQYLNEKVVGPAFTKADGYNFSGFGASSGDLEPDIASGEIHPNVFESVGGDNIAPLFPKFTRRASSSGARTPLDQLASLPGYTVTQCGERIVTIPAL